VSIGESAIITATFALTVHLPMRAILLDRMWVLIRLLCFSPVRRRWPPVFYDRHPGSGGFAVCGISIGCGSVECNESQLKSILESHDRERRVAQSRGTVADPLLRGCSSLHTSQSWLGNQQVTS
jgi:hypothetical protein